MPDLIPWPKATCRSIEIPPARDSTGFIGHLSIYLNLEKKTMKRESMCKHNAIKV
jgi:hypothetical protein